MFPDATFEAHAVDWRPGDLLALITDGLLEVFDAQDRELGLEWAGQVLAAHHDRPLAEIAALMARSSTIRPFCSSAVEAHELIARPGYTVRRAGQLSWTPRSISRNFAFARAAGST